MSLLQPNNNSNVDFILSEISKLSFEEREVVRISLAAEYWQNHLHELVQQPATVESFFDDMMGCLEKGDLQKEKADIRKEELSKEDI